MFTYDYIPTDCWLEKMSLKAHNKINIIDWHGWIFTTAEQGGLFITGAPCPLITRGENKGRPNYKKALHHEKCMVYLSKEECKQ